ncbi:SecDF P1 head subdomain-containing protein [Streptomyces sp. GSL17-111]|uniref:SecDF P1 head subdomain-containing protein n=1 Tax=Streptomyces sp. GSL17-111 TaxID=3121596 RepID=UPI0030F42968
MQEIPFRAVALRAAAAVAVLALAACSSNTATDDREAGPTGQPSSAASPESSAGDAPPLAFAPVRTSTPGACPSSAQEGTWLADTNDPESPVCYGVQEDTALRVTGPVEAEAEFAEEQGTWLVNVSLAGADAERFGELTERLSTQSPPQNRLAIVLGEWEAEPRVLSAPSVAAPLRDGRLQISGTFTQDSARALATELNR